MKGSSSIIFIALAIGIFFVFTDPQYKEVQRLQDIKKENEALIERATQLRAQRQQLMDKYNSISPADREKLNKVLPETVDNVRLILDIDNIARRNGILLRNIAISGDFSQQEENTRVIDRTARNYGSIQLSFGFSADYVTMKRFLGALENSLRIVDIKDLSVNAAGEAAAYSYSLTLNTYWLR